MSTGGCMTVHSTGSDSSGGPSFGRPYHRVIPSGMPPRSDRDNRRGPPRGGGGYHHDDGSYGPPTVKPRMPRMGPPPNPYHRGGGDNNHRYNNNRDSSQQSVDSRMSRSMEEDEIMEMQRTQQSRGGGALRSPPPPPPSQQQQRPLQTPRYPSPPPRRSDYDDESVGQETISTSGWRSFYSGDYTTERSVTSRDRYQPPDNNNNNYDQPMPPPPRDTFRPARYGSAGRAPPSYGGGYHSRAPPRSPPRDYSPPRRRQGQAPRPSSHSERPLIEVAPGLMMHLMGTDDTMKAIQEGHITVTCCVVCGMDVHCHSASEYVLCPDCRVVSPVHHQMDMDDENGAASRMMMTPQQGGLVGLGVKTQMLRTMLGEGDQQQQSRQY